MISLNARLERFHDGINTWEQFSIPLNSHLHLYLEHSLLQSRLQLEAIVHRIQNAYTEWRHSHEMGRLPTTRIVEIYGKCITVKKQISRLKTYAAKQREFEKLHKLLQQLTPYTADLRTAIDKLQIAVNVIEATIEDAKKLLAVPGLSELIFYRHWTVLRFTEFLQLLFNKFQWELERKKLIEVRIINTMDRDELRTCRNHWQLLHQTKEYTEFMLQYIEFEKEITELSENGNNPVQVN